MRGLMISGHGQFASGMLDALHKIMGEPACCAAVRFDTSRDETEFEMCLREAVEKFCECDQILIACDLCGGTPYKTAVKLSFEDERLLVIGGVNLPVLIELALAKDREEALLVSEILTAGKESLSYFEYMEFDDEDEE